MYIDEFKRNLSIYNLSIYLSIYIIDVFQQGHSVSLYPCRLPNVNKYEMIHCVMLAEKRCV